MTSHTRVLHTLRCGGTGLAPTIAVASGLPVDEVEEVLLDLQAAGSAAHADGPFGGWSVTPVGKARAERAAVDELAASGRQDAVAAAYDDFLVLNPGALDACTAWQLRPRGGVLVDNHHDDPSYDAGVLRRLGRLRERLEPVLVTLTSAASRFGAYGPRLDHALDHALEQARGGDRAAVTERTESFHSAWFQLHEDLLVTLGRPRW